MNVIEAAGLGRRFWKTWAVRHCTLAIPAGRVAALTGPNGAGKTTLMHMAVGLIAPTEGRVTVLGGQPAGSPEMAVTAVCTITVANLTHNRLHYWLLDQVPGGTLLARQ